MFIKQLASNVDLLAVYANDCRVFPYLLTSCGAEGWDILFALPESTQVFNNSDGAAFFDALCALSIDESVQNPYHLPFLGGWFVYLGYELLSALEPRVPTAHVDSFPLAVLTRIPAALLYNRAHKSTWLVAETVEQQRCLEAACLASEFQPRPVSVSRIVEDPAGWYIDAIAQIKDYIRAGDVFQVNISRGWRAQLPPHIEAADLFAALQRINPAPFSALANFGGVQIISSSPERLVRVRQGYVETRPIAGTCARSLDPIQDASLKHHLLSSVKERAEHVMLIDLARNDIGRIAVPGTVKVDELMAVQSYPYVHHIESNVRARLQYNIHPMAVLRALFPGGTITGCPKVRTMQIIRALEPSARRAYTGSLGYLNRDGSMDINILIRTFMKEGQQLRFRAGGGIVADSDAQCELMETHYKAQGLLHALGVSAS